MVVTGQAERVARDFPFRSSPARTRFGRSSHQDWPHYRADRLAFAERQDGTMTFVGKILVVVIMVFALFFLAVSTVVFSTAKNWKDETTKLTKSISDLNQKVKAANDEAALRKNELETAQADFKKSTDALEAQIKTTNQTLTDRQKELTEQRTIVETAQETTRTALAQAEARTKETELLHNQLLAVTKQSDEYKIRQN